MAAVSHEVLILILILFFDEFYEQTKNFKYPVKGAFSWFAHKGQFTCHAESEKITLMMSRVLSAWVSRLKMFTESLRFKLRAWSLKDVRHGGLNNMLLFVP